MYPQQLLIWTVRNLWERVHTLGATSLYDFTFNTLFDFGVISCNYSHSTSKIADIDRLETSGSTTENREERKDF